MRLTKPQDLCFQQLPQRMLVSTVHYSHLEKQQSRVLSVPSHQTMGLELHASELTETHHAVPSWIVHGQFAGTVSEWNNVTVLRHYLGDLKPCVFGLSSIQLDNVHTLLRTKGNWCEMKIKKIKLAFMQKPLTSTCPLMKGHH